MLVATTACSPEEIEVRVDTQLDYCANFHYGVGAPLTPSTAFPRNVQISIPQGSFSVPIESDTREPEIAESTNVDFDISIEFPHGDPTASWTLPEVPMTALAGADIFYGKQESSMNLTTAELAPLYNGGERDGWVRLRWEEPSSEEKIVLRPFVDESGANRVSVFTNDTDLSQCDLSGFPRVRRISETERGTLELSWLVAELDWARHAPLADRGVMTLHSGETIEQHDWRHVVMGRNAAEGGFLFDEPAGDICGFWVENMDNPLGMNPGPPAIGHEIECETLALVNPFDILTYEEVVEFDGT